MIPEFKQFKKYIFDELNFSPYLFKEKYIKRFFDRLIKKIDNEQNLVNSKIESNIVNLSLWGEEFAKRIKGINILFDTTEGYTYLDDFKKEFIYYKSINKGVFTNGQSSFYELLKDKYDVTKDMFIKFSPVTNVGVPNINISPKYMHLKNDNEILFGSIGRLEKPFVMPMLHQLVNYIKSHREKHYKIILIGDASRKKERRNIEKFLKENKISYIITGYMNPISLKLISQVDVFLSSAGSASLSGRCAIPTIVYSTINNKPVGFYKYKVVSMYDEGNDEIFSKLIDDSLNGNVDLSYSNDEILLFANKNYESQLKKYDIYGGLSYFNTLEKNISNTEKKYRLLLCFFGAKILLSILKVVKK